jgi:hypothetical protein
VLQALNLRRRARAAGVHLSISLAVAGLAAVLVFGLWYPGPYRLLSGGRDLFVLLTMVDVVLGPALTFVVFSLGKSRRHLSRDLAIIGTIQLGALVYGLHTVFIVRPVAMVFEVDRFRVVSAAEVHLPELPKARAEYRCLPLTGPWLLGARFPEPGAERNDALFMALGGIDVAQRPLFWQPYAASAPAAWARARPVSALLEHYAMRAEELRGRLRDMKADATTSRFLPLVARVGWVVVLDDDGLILGHLPVDGFF